MRISSKISLAVVCASVVVFGSISAVQLWMERADLEASVVKELVKLDHAAAEAVRLDFQNKDDATAMSYLQGLERFDTELDVVFFRAKRRRLEGFESSSAEELARLQSLARRAHETGRTLTEIHRLESGDRAVMVASPVEGSPNRGAVVMVDSLREIDADLRAEALVSAIGVALFSFVAALLAFAMGEFYVRRPLSSLSSAMKALAAGDDRSSLEPASADDEVGEVLSHFERMRDELGETRKKLALERRRHEAILVRLGAADRLTSIGQLAAGLAHEIGSPLQILLGRTGALIELSPPSSPQREVAQVIREQLLRVTKIVQRHLDFARPAQRSQSVSSVRDLPDPIVDLLAGEAREKDVNVVVSTSSSDRIRVDVDAVHQILLNLLRNAIFATPRGGQVVVEVGLDNGKIDSPNLSYLTIVVLDEGPGIPPSLREKIFEPFYTTAGESPGTGLGLTVVRHLVRELHGTLEVTDGPSRGACFKIGFMVPIVGDNGPEKS